MIKAANLESYFILLGFQYNTLSFIKEADIIVHPSRFEGKSNAVDEALFCCKPTVVTNYATATEVIENEVNGIICEMSGECIAYSVERLMNDKALRESLSTSCRNKKEDVDANEVLLTLC